MQYRINPNERQKRRAVTSGRGSNRRAFSTTELVVAASMLVVVMSFAVPMTYRATRLWKDSRHQQLAVEELSDQIELLTALDEDARTKAISSISVPPWILHAAPEATVEAERVQDADGSRLVLTLHWNRVDRPTAPVRLIGWLDPLATEEEAR